MEKVIEANEETDSIVTEKIKKILSELDVKDTDEKTSLNRKSFKFYTVLKLVFKKLIS